jgi:hypothetical protein
MKKRINSRSLKTVKDAWLESYLVNYARIIAPNEQKHISTTSDGEFGAPSITSLPEIPSNTPLRN